MEITVYILGVERCNLGLLASRLLFPVVMQKTKDTLQVLYIVLISLVQEFTFYVCFQSKFRVGLGFVTYVVGSDHCGAEATTAQCSQAVTRSLWLLKAFSPAPLFVQILYSTRLFQAYQEKIHQLWSHGLIIATVSLQVKVILSYTEVKRVCVYRRNSSVLNLDGRPSLAIKKVCRLIAWVGISFIYC